MTDPVADMLTRIRNASAVGHESVLIPFSRLKLAILQSLESEGYVKEITKQVDNQGHAQLKITLRYDKKEPLITRLERISTPGRRVYMPAKKIKPVLSGQGTLILSTNLGVMTSKEARQKNVGGEVICRVW